MINLCSLTKACFRDSPRSSIELHDDVLNEFVLMKVTCAWIDLLEQFLCSNFIVGIAIYVSF